jgi:hypothetical protein
MLQAKTHYEQVPVEIVRKILEEQIRQDPPSEQDQGTSKKPLKEDLIAEQQAETGSGTFSKRES